MSASEGSSESTQKQELSCFLLIVGVAAPALAVTVVIGYGFLVWMSQLIGGPPTGP